MQKPPVAVRLGHLALLILLPLGAATPRAAAARSMPIWGAVPAPSGGPARVIGHYGAACLAGGLPLPLDGVGYQVIDPARRRNFGHPVLVNYLGDLGRAVAAQELGIMLVGDMAQPRGGPMTFGHLSHQGGLDVDVWFRLDRTALPLAQRDGLIVPSVIDVATGRPDPERWTEAHAQLVRLAALDPRVSRVFVGAAIKRDLCQRVWSDPDVARDRRWLNVVRTWPGHDDHLHVRLRCPPDSPACVDQPSLAAAASDGCSPAAIAMAFARERAERFRRPVTPNRSVPSACLPLLTAAK